MTLQHEIGTWALETFGEGQRNRGVMNHLIKEIRELNEKMIEEEDLSEECADCLILLFDLAHRNGFDLIEEVVKKFEINKTREWGEIDEFGVIEHL